MAKEKADKIHVHRIEFQQKERELLETAMTAYSVNKVSTPIIALLSDVSAMSLLTAAYVSYKYGPDGIALLKDSYEDSAELAQDFFRISKNLVPLADATLQFGGISVVDIYNLFAPKFAEV